jgi:hypothetical protein
MKADGIEYDERMALLDQITWPQPLQELLEATYAMYRQTHPWLPEDALGPKSVLREMWEQAMGFTDFVRRYELARSEGLVLRYLSDAYRTLRQTVPDAHRSPDLETIIEWLGETIRQTDSSLIDEWEALSHPDEVLAHRDEPAPPAASAVGAGAGAHRDGAQRDVRPGDGLCRDDLDALMRLERAAADRFEPPRDVLHDPVPLGRGARGLLPRARDAGHRRGRPRAGVLLDGRGGDRRAAGRRGGYDGPVAAGPADAGGPRRPSRLGDRGGGRPGRHRRGRRAGPGGDRVSLAHRRGRPRARSPGRHQVGP